MNLEKIKDAARKFEQKEEWRKAIEVYQKAIQEFESGQDTVPDVSIYNRVGDLHLKANEPAAAVQVYERAVDLYADQGFSNNAIALCGKILRVNPGRVQTYLKLAYLHARKNVVIEAKKNLLEYLERMNQNKHLDEAFQQVKKFADHFPDSQDIRLMLGELLRAASRKAGSKEHLAQLADELEAAGDAAGARRTREALQAIEDGVEDAPKPPKRGDLVFLDVGGDAPTAAPRAAPPPQTAPRVSGPVRAPVPPRQTPPPPPRQTPPSQPRKTVATPAPPGAPTTRRGASPPEAIDDSLLGLETPLAKPESLVSNAGADSLIPSGEGLDIEPTALNDSADTDAGPIEGLEVTGFEAGSDFAAGGDLTLDSLSGSDDTGFGPDAPIESLVEVDQSFVLDGSLGGDAPLDLIQPGADQDTTDFTGSLGGGIREISFDEPPTPEPELDDSLSFVDMAIEMPEEPAQATIDELEERILDDPENPELHRLLGEALLADGETPRGLEELDLALVGYETIEDWGHSLDVVNELIRLDPGSVRYYQKRVELAYRAGDRSRLIDAYLELGDALMRSGALEKALAVYRRVAEHEPNNPRAVAALQTLAPVDEPPPPKAAAVVTPRRSDAAPKPAPKPAPTPEPRAPAPVLKLPAAAPQRVSPPVAKAPPKPFAGTPKLTAKSAPPSDDGDYIDLGALIMDDDAPILDARMRMEDEQPTGDEQADFEEMLAAFKQGIDRTLGAEDFESHYDLGIAFKEMGLLDEAVAEFQKALRATEGRLRTSEALGVCFFEKHQFVIAESILRGAVENLAGGDDAKIGLLYWLGRCLEEHGKAADALAIYERALAIDIRFQDLGTRVPKLTAGRSS